MKKKIIMILITLMMLLPVNALASTKKGDYTIDSLEEALTSEEVEHDLSDYEESSDAATIYLFYGHTCGFCKKFLTFVNSILPEYGKYFKLEAYEVWNNSSNNKLMNDVAKKLDTKADGVPFIVIGDKTFGGYSEAYDDSIKSAITALYNSEERYDVMEHLDEKEVNKGAMAVLIVFGVIVVGIASIAVVSVLQNKKKHA